MKRTIIEAALMLAVIAICLLISKVWFEAIMQSGLPMWLKYILLR